MTAGPGSAATAGTAAPAARAGLGTVGPDWWKADPLKTASWLIRLVVFAPVCVIVARGRTDHGAVVLGALVAVGVLVAAWAVIDIGEMRGRVWPGWVLLVVLAALGTVAGLVTALPVADSLVAFAIIAAVGAGNDLPSGQAWAVAGIIVVALEVSSLLFGFDNGDLGWPVAVVAGILAGRQRQDARIQSAQAVALVAQADRTRAQEQRAATLDERTRIAREIHDLLAHSLGALGIQIEAAHALLADAGDIERALPLLEQSRRLAASGLEETRRAIEALRTDAPPLPETLAGLAESHRQQSGSPVELAVSGVARPLSPDANLALIRTAGEALVNAAKHAPHAAVSIDLDYRPEETTMTVENEAQQTSTSAPAPTSAPAANGHAGGSSGGYGLAGMRERLLLIGGTLTAGPSERGWTVRAQIPL